MAKRLYTIKEASRYLGVTVGSLYQMVHRRTVPHVKIGKRLRFDADKLNEYISSNSIEVIDYEN